MNLYPFATETLNPAMTPRERAPHISRQRRIKLRVERWIKTLQRKQKETPPGPDQTLLSGYPQSEWKLAA